MHRLNSARFFVRTLVVTALLASGAQAQKRPMELEDLFRLKRVADPQVSPDGTRVAFTITEVLKDENRTNADIWIAPVDGGAEPRRLTQSPKRDAHARWSPDGRWIAFESTRSGEAQIWVIAADGGEARQLTMLATGAGRPVWAPDGKSLAFVSAVFADFSGQPFKEADAANRERLAAEEKTKVKARTFDTLLYRHWDSWVDGKRQHIFVMPVADGAAAGEPRNVTPGPNDAVPTSSTFEEGDEFTFSPDGREIVFTAPHHELREQAWRTNHDLWAVDLASGAKRNLTAANPAADGQPRFSPDGKRLAYRAQARAGFEADKWSLWVLTLATGERSNLSGKWDRSIDEFVWLPDGKGLVGVAQEQGRRALFRFGLGGEAVEKLATRGSVGELGVTQDGATLVFTAQGFNRPPEVRSLPLAGGEGRPITRINATLVEQMADSPPESVTVNGAGGAPVQMFILKPPGFVAGKKYPVAFWVHGGPQSAFLDAWSTRWNAKLWAAQGYVVALPNPRGSTGFGQKFTDEISRDWGGKVFEDLMACVAYLEKQDYVDASRMAAAGASYGGYMMNWFQGHTDKFRTLVTHCGVYDFTSMYGTTEEVWFTEWDLGIPWETADFERWSPHRHAAKFRTPNLIIHNELDFRVPVSQGMALFTTLQRKGVPSRFLYFPDEGHWVLKPQNSALWHRTVFDWLAEYLKQ